MCACHPCAGAMLIFSVFFFVPNLNFDRSQKISQNLDGRNVQSQINLQQAAKVDTPRPNHGHFFPLELNCTVESFSLSA